MKKNKGAVRITAMLLACVMAVAALGGCDSKSSNTTKETGAKTAKSTTLAATGDTLSKDETVYVICGSQGDVSKIIVSDWIKNGTNDAKISDKTDLKNVKSVKGNTTYSLTGDKSVTWDANGGDIYYQGTSDNALPVDMNVQYSLDGKSISSDALEGKSGKVKIRFNYKNNKYKNVTIDGQPAKIYVPFAMVTGMMIDNKVFSNVEVSNGKVINMGDNSIVAGFAMPGMQESIGIDADKLEIPDYVEITADVKKFKFGETMTFASNEMFNDIKTDKFSDIDDLKKSMNELTSAMTKLIDGSSAIYDNLGTLLSSCKTLVGAINQISDGVTKLNAVFPDLYNGTVSLRDGLKKLSDNSATLNGGAEEVFNTLLTTANTQLASAGLDKLGIKAPKLTVSDYDSQLGKTIGAFGGEKAYQSALAATAKKGTTFTDAGQKAIIGNTVKAAESTVTAAVKKAAEAEVRTAVEAKKDEVYAAATALTVKQQLMASGKSESEADAIIASAAGQQMVASAVANLTDEQKTAAVNAAVESKMNSDDIKNRISEQETSALDGLKQIVALRLSLKKYQQFYDGLKQYTAGVDTAYSGANTLSDSVKTLTEKISELNDGVNSLKEKTAKLPDGVSQLKDGAMQISDGLKKLNDQGIGKLADLVNGDVEHLRARVEAISDVSKSYNNYSGKTDEMDGKVKFIYKTAKIGK